MKCGLNQLPQNNDFTPKTFYEKTVYTYNGLLKPYISIDNEKITTDKPVKHIAIIHNHILQCTEIELTDSQNLLLKHIRVDNSNPENTQITYYDINE